jgi:hypothetical protein
MSLFILVLIIFAVITITGMLLILGIRLIISGAKDIKKKDIKVENKETLLEKQIDEIFRSKC